MGSSKAQILVTLLLITVLVQATFSTALNCSDTSRVCSSFLAFKPSPEQTLPVIQSMFDVLLKDITVEGNGRDTIFIKKNCSCVSNLSQYLTFTTFTVRESNRSVNDLLWDSYDGLAYFPPNSTTRAARKGEVVSLRLLCGCSSGLWNYLMSYVMAEGDSVESLASRFGVSMDSIEKLNGIDNPDNVTVGALYYVPLNSAPGEPYPVKNTTAPAPAPEPATSTDHSLAVDHVNHKSHAIYWWIIGSLAVGLALVVILVVLFVALRSSAYFMGSQGSHSSQAKDSDGRTSHKFHILRNSSFCCASRRSIRCESKELKHPNRASSNRNINIPSVIGTDVFDVETPIVFAYEDILSSTDGFSESSLLGHGTNGSVYYGQLRDQEVAIKKMTAMKTKEFMAEMKVLCKVHHSNLVELIGYAASTDDLFLVYEYAQMGSLRNHLHDPQSKGHTPLSWIIRVQIALDTARGLEYVHEHTKPHYVHRDIKSSNILLDGSFRAKISDFGLAKLVMSAEGEASVTRVVGTYGYLAPEYLTDGLATSKSDVYAFGVVLFELISGKEAMTRTSERRSLVSIMLAALRNTPDSTSMSSLKDHIDPSLLDLCPHDCLFKVAMLAKQCVDDDPVLRPDMKQVVISLSQILLSSVEWEATLSGNSQIFSGLVQGR